MASVKVAVELPAVFVAVTVSSVLESATLGVPDIRPLPVFKVTPVGSEGVMEKLETVPPVLVIA
jgi:hypothetical protein